MGLDTRQNVKLDNFLSRGADLRADSHSKPIFEYIYIDPISMNNLYCLFCRMAMSNKDIEDGIKRIIWSSDVQNAQSQEQGKTKKKRSKKNKKGKELSGEKDVMRDKSDISSVAKDNIPPPPTKHDFRGNKKHVNNDCTNSSAAMENSPHKQSGAINYIRKVSNRKRERFSPAKQQDGTSLNTSLDQRDVLVTGL